MAQKINLLPKEYATSESASSLVKTMSLVSILGLVAFFIAAVLAGVYYYILSNQEKDLIMQKATLEENISHFEQSEQGIVVLKNRIGIVNLIINDTGATENVDKFIKLAEAYPEDVLIGRTEIDPDKITSEVRILSSAALTEFMALLVAENDYAQLVLSEFSLTPESGYKIEFVASNTITANVE